MTIELTAKRPNVLPERVHHALEDILASPLTRFVLRMMTRTARIRVSLSDCAKATITQASEPKSR